MTPPGQKMKTRMVLQVGRPRPRRAGGAVGSKVEELLRVPQVPQASDQTTKELGRDERSSRQEISVGTAVPY